MDSLVSSFLPRLSIKTPQLIGIAAGVLVFVTTIAVVLYLLYASGSFSKLWHELQQGDVGVKGTKSNTTVDKAYEFPQLQDAPLLYDELLKARKTLDQTPNVPDLEAEDQYKKVVSLRAYDQQRDRQELVKACDGRALYHESAYDLGRLWNWFDYSRLSGELVNFGDFERKSLSVTGTNANSQQHFSADRHFDVLYNSYPVRNGRHLVIVDAELGRQIGMLTLLDNDPKSLSIRIENVWITPAFQKQQRAYHAMLLLFSWLFGQEYRRVWVEIDERHFIARRFLERCGMTCEGVLRKHRVVQDRNRNSAVYAITNSDWTEGAEARLKTRVGVSPKKPPAVNGLEIRPFQLEVGQSSSHKAGTQGGSDPLAKLREAARKRLEASAARTTAPAATAPAAQETATTATATALTTPATASTVTATASISTSTVSVLASTATATAAATAATTQTAAATATALENTQEGPRKRNRKKQKKAADSGP